MTQWWIPLAAGGCAGTATDIFLFPLDTIKTRLQAPGGFAKAGGFAGMYRGLGSAAAASAPAAAAFFGSYEYVKAHLLKRFPDVWAPGIHMTAASFGELVSAAVRVPFEVNKQRRQAGVHGADLLSTGPKIASLLRSYVSLVSREVPFALIQYPLYERLKAVARGRAQRSGRTVAGWEMSLCGSIAGGISAALTTPLDVAKTRTMLSDGQLGLGSVLSKIVRTEGYGALFHGIAPRVTWISVGGAVFFGVSERAIVYLNGLAPEL